MEKKHIHELIIIGGGPTALTAAIYTGRENIDTLIIEKAIVGGQAATTDWIDNYPGFPEGVSGSRLAKDMRKQAERFGAKFCFEEVISLHRTGDIVEVVTKTSTYNAKTVLIATGTSHKKLNIPNEQEYISRGVHYCAICDGAFYTGRDIIVVGGGNSAVQEALFLTRFAKNVTLLVRSELKASDVLQKELQKNSKIKVVTNVTTDEIWVENEVVKGAKVTHKDTQLQEVIEADGIFIFVGLLPNTGFLQSTDVHLNEEGSVIANASDLLTNIPGVYVAGDVRSDSTLQIATAVGEGATAALRIRKYLETL